ncbi:MAG: phosphodiester glycosidase family protein [Pyrinomonadaceae bacterium]
MRRIPSKSVRSGFLISLCVLCAYAVNIPAQDFKTLKDGIEYAEVAREINGKPVNLNLLRLDLKKVRLDVHHAMDAAIGTEKTSSIAARHGAFAAINGGFFRLDTSIFAGDAAGVLMVDGELLSEGSNNRAILRIDNEQKATKAAIEHLDVKSWFGLNHSAFFGPIDGVNRERKTAEAVAYTLSFGKTTLSKPGGVEILISCTEWRTDLLPTSLCRATTLAHDGDHIIPDNGFVISLSPETFTRKESILAGLNFYRKQSSNRRYFYLRAEVLLNGNRVAYDANTDMVAGVPQLIKNGKIDITWEREKASKSFVETRHPRTAVAKLKDGKFLMITVDGRSEASAGIDLYDLAKLLLELGATDAMNLDGGGSTTMFVDGRVVNKPSDKEGERKVSDMILVTLRDRGHRYMH